MPSFAELADVLFVGIAAPLLALAGLLLMVLLRFPVISRLPEAWRTLRLPAAGEGPHPAASAALSGAASLGAGAIVSGATAVSLGGAGALAWLWIVALFVAPLRVADVLLARTNPPGRASGEPPGSLARRLEGEPGGGVRWLGGGVLVALLVAGTVGVFAVHGAAVGEAARLLAPERSALVGVVVALASIALVAIDWLRPWVGWIALFALFALFVLFGVAAFAEPSRALGALGQALGDLFEGPAPVGAFSGAERGELFSAALAYVLPPLVLSLGLDGALFAQTRGSTRAVASTALFGTLFHTLVATVVGVALVATGAYSRRVDGERSLREVSFVEAPFETASQRLDPARRWTGYLRVIEGRPQAAPLDAATERGMIRELRYVDADGSPSDFALRIERGRPTGWLRPDEVGALQRADARDMSEIRVEGAMLPRGASLLASALTRAGGEPLAAIALGVLLLLAACGAAAFGVGIERSFVARLGEKAARVAALVPPLTLLAGALLAGGPAVDALALGLFAAAFTTIAVALGLLAKASEASRL